MTGPTLYPGQKPPSGLRLWLRVLGDWAYAAWVAVKPSREPQEPPEGR